MYNLCSQVDRDDIVRRSANVRVEAVDQADVIPGSVLTVTGQDFQAIHSLRNDLHLVFRFFVYLPAQNQWRTYTTTSWIVSDDTHIVVDVPKDIDGPHGALSLESLHRNMCTNGHIAMEVGFGWLRVTYAPRDPMLVPVNDLTATLQQNGDIDLTWSDIAGERWYAPAFRPIGQSQWNSVNWLPGYSAQYPADTTRLVITGLTPPETFEFRVTAGNYVSSSRSNIASIGVVRRADVHITNLPSMATPFCTAQPFVSGVSAFFDQDSDGVVAGFPNRAPNVLFPADLIVNINSYLGYDIVAGSTFATGAGTQANLVVIASFFSCPHNAPQFVAAYFAVYGQQGNLVFEPVHLLAGDEFDTLTVGGDPLKGVVMHGSFDGSLDREAFDKGIAAGSVVGSVTQGTLMLSYGVTIEFGFEVPIETR